MSSPSSLTLPVVGEPPQVPSLGHRLNAIRQPLLALDERASIARFDLRRFDRVLKTTISLCPECLAHTGAIVFTRHGRVLIRTRCELHGLSDAVVENDETYYHLSNKDQWGRCFADDRIVEFPPFQGGCCGEGGCAEPSLAAGGSAVDFTDQTANKTCTILVEVTNACNLACPVCYSDAKGDRKLPLEMFKQYILRLIEQKQGLDSVQLTGGEAVLHPEFWAMVAFLHAQSGVKKIYLPTNGIAFARIETAERLVPFRDKMMVLLQFDGRSEEGNHALRAANTVRIRDQVLDHLQRLGIHMQLTMTLTRGVNDHEVGWVVDTGMRHSMIKVIALQPVTYSGRYDLSQDPMRRLTLSDVIKAVVAQARRRVAARDFVPIPCSHPNCGWLTLFVRRWGLILNLVRYIDPARVMNRVAYKTLLSTDEVREVVGGRTARARDRLVAAVGRRLIRSTDVFGIAVKPFMDRFSYDQDRISNCCHHLMDTGGRAVSFCEYNALLRPGDPWDSFPTLQPNRESARATPRL